MNKHIFSVRHMIIIMAGFLIIGCGGGSDNASASSNTPSNTSNSSAPPSSGSKSSPGSLSSASSATNSSTGSLDSSSSAGANSSSSSSSAGGGIIGSSSSSSVSSTVNSSASTVSSTGNSSSSSSSTANSSTNSSSSSSLAGSSSSSAPSGAPQIATAHYVDAAINGISYECGGQHGTTDTAGTFSFEVGQGCVFSLGNLHIRTLRASDLSDGAIIFESDRKIAALLQSLDADGDPSNGIRIENKVVSALAESGVVEIPDNEIDLNEIIEKVSKRLTSHKISTVSYARAAGHLAESYAKYTGSGNGAKLRLTDADAFRQISSGPVLYGMPVQAAELPYNQYRLAPLTDAEFNALSDEQRYKVAVKLYGTLFYGVGYDELVKSVDSGIFISQTHALFDRENSDTEITAVENMLQDYYSDGLDEKWLVSTLLARMYHLKPGQAYFNRWAAYVLSQTILFSPAYELDTVYTVDAIDVYGDLVRDFDAGFSMQWVTFKHMMTDENWRRFRSPEDNGREMLEIYLMDFNDAHVPLAAKALKNWKLDRRSNTLIMTLNENLEPITALFPGKTVKNGTDFYSTLVLQPNFVPTASRRLVDIYFPNFTQNRKDDIARQLIASRPMTWTSLLKQIVYSKEYLLHSAKTRSFEESFFQIAKALEWHPKAKSFYYIGKNLNNMHQSTMRYKLGRKVEVPLDSQSFAWFHKTIREKVMINYERNASLESHDDGWPYTGTFKTLPDELFSTEEIDENGKKVHPQWDEAERQRAKYIIDRLFIPIAGRKANSEESDLLADLIDNEKYDKDIFDNIRWLDLYGNKKEADDLKKRGDFAMLVLDYLSRISGIYEFEAVK